MAPFSTLTNPCSESQSGFAIGSYLDVRFGLVSVVAPFSLVSKTGSTQSPHVSTIEAFKKSKERCSFVLHHRSPSGPEQNTLPA